MSTPEQHTIGKFYGGTFYDLTSQCTSHSYLPYENKINSATFTFNNDLKQPPFIQLIEGSAAAGTTLDLYDLLQIYRVSDNFLLYTGEISEIIPVVSESGSFLTVQTYAYPAVGLNRTRVNNTYGTYRSPMKFREIMVDGKENVSTLFPYVEHYTETKTVAATPNTNGSDWWYAQYPIGGGDNTTVAKVSSDGSYTPKTGSYFIVMANSSGHTFNARFGTITGATPEGFPLSIDSLSNPTYNSATATWSNIPYLDFWIYRYHTTGTFNVEIQLRNSDNNYIRFQLTDQDHGAATSLTGNDENIDLIPEDSAWHHLQIPIGSKWGEAPILWDGVNHKDDNHSDDTVISTRCGWNTLHSTAENAWNGLLDINFYVTQGLSAPTTMTVGLDSLKFTGLNAGTITVKDYVTGGPTPYAIDFNYVCNLNAAGDTIPYANFIFEQATKTIMDLCNLEASIRYINDGSPGVHWTEVPYVESGLPKTHLCIAPLGNHNVNGLDSSHKPETLWPTYSKYTVSNPLVLGTDLVATNFSKKEAEANVVYANAVYQYPFQNEWCQTDILTQLTTASEVWCDGTFPGTFTQIWRFYASKPANPAASSGDAVVGPNSICFPKLSGGALGSNVTAAAWLTLPTPIDLNLISSPTLTFWLKSNKLMTVEVRVYTDLYDVPDDWLTTYPLSINSAGNYFWQEITNQTNNAQWTKFELPLGAGRWKIEKDSGTTNHATWSKPLQMILFRIVGNTDLLGGYPDGYFYLDGLNINGSHIRGVYSPNAITAMGGMKTALINEVLYAGSILDAAVIDQLDNLLVQECLRDITTPTTGSFQTEMDTTVMQGQMIWLSSPPFGAAPKQFRVLWIKHDQQQPPTPGLSTVYVTDDLTNSYARDPSDAASNAVKSVAPEYQNRTFARLAVAGIPPKSIISKVVDIDTL